MAHFAEINSDNIVIRVVDVDDIYEADGENWCKDFFGGNWKQTSYNGRIRKNYAGIGYSYDSNRDAFVPPKPSGNYELNEVTCAWEEVDA